MASTNVYALTFTVPHLVPVSGNHYKEPIHYRKPGSISGHLSFKLTRDAKAFYDAVAIFAHGETVAPPTMAERRKTRYGVRIDVYLGKGQRGDFDNFWKCGLDALVKCGVIHSDAAVDGEHSKCVIHRDERDNPRTLYSVTRIESET
jgi:hypothetical protein